MNIKRSILLTFALMLALSGAVYGSAVTAPAPPAAEADDVSDARRIDCYSEQQWDYEESYYDSAAGQYVTVYQVFERKCYESGWDGSVQCGDWHFTGWDEVRTGGGDWTPGD